MSDQTADRYAGYTRLKFDRPHPRVLRITMENGRMNTADAAMHAVEAMEDAITSAEFRRDLVLAVTRRALERAAA